MLHFGLLARPSARNILPDIVDFSRLRPDPSRSATHQKKQGRAHSVLRSFATCGVIVIVLVPFDIDTGGGRRKERYQYILVLCMNDK